MRSCTSLAVLAGMLALRNIAVDEANPMPVMLGLLLMWGAVLFIRGYSRKQAGLT